LKGYAARMGTADPGPSLVQIQYLIKFKGNIGIRQKPLNDIEGRIVLWKISVQ
jgi:hypothetical protein